MTELQRSGTIGNFVAGHIRKLFRTGVYVISSDQEVRSDRIIRTVALTGAPKKICPATHRRLVREVKRTPKLIARTLQAVLEEVGTCVRRRQSRGS